MTYQLLIALILAALSFSACSTSNSATSSEKSVPAQENVRPDGSIYDDQDYFRSLADFLRRVPGVSVSGSGDNAFVTVRGINSFNADITPLYVIDGVAVGNSYYEANNLLNPRDIDHVRVLKGSDAAIYGVRGGNGVILIVTRGS